MMTDEEYAEKSGGSCPVCGNENIEGMNSVQVDSGVAWQFIRCHYCGAGWNDCYDLTGFNLVEESSKTQLQIETMKVAKTNP